MSTYNCASFSDAGPRLSGLDTAVARVITAGRPRQNSKVKRYLKIHDFPFYLLNSPIREELV